MTDSMVALCVCALDIFRFLLFFSSSILLASLCSCILKVYFSGRRVTVEICICACICVRILRKYHLRNFVCHRSSFFALFCSLCLSLSPSFAKAQTDTCIDFYMQVSYIQYYFLFASLKRIFSPFCNVVHCT